MAYRVKQVSDGVVYSLSRPQYMCLLMLNNFWWSYIFGQCWTSVYSYIYCKQLLMDLYVQFLHIRPDGIVHIFSFRHVPDGVVGFPPGTVEVGPVLGDTAKVLHWQWRIWNTCRVVFSVHVIIPLVSKQRIKPFILYIPGPLQNPDNFLSFFVLCTWSKQYATVFFVPRFILTRIFTLVNKKAFMKKI